MSTEREELLKELRPTAFAIAYRMLGSTVEAEDVVQEALLRVHTTLQAGERIRSPRAYIVTVATRLAIDHLRSAQARREVYVGEWLPAPILTANGSDPARQAEIADSLSLAFLVLLESLSPEQRAVLLLRDVFEYDFDEIAQVVGKTEQNTRQLAVRARRHVNERRPRFESSRKERDELAERFLDAARNGDLDALERLLAHDIVLRGDGGGNAPALARSLHGRQRVARTLLAWTRHGLRHGQFSRAEVNGQPGAVGRDLNGRLVSVLALDIADGQIQGVNAIVNPDKLRGLEEPDHARLLRHDEDVPAASAPPAEGRIFHARCS